MRSIFLLLISAFTALSLSAQVTITPGAELHITGNGLLTLHNTGLINNGTFNTGTSVVLFTGSANSSIQGGMPVIFYELHINKDPGNSVVLLRSITANNRVSFISGLLNLQNHNLTLNSTGFLNNENEESRITSSASGRVTAIANLNAPQAANPGNLGAIISSAQNLGNVEIMRGHTSQVNASGHGASIRRYFDITPTNNNNLNATLRFRYLDEELNGLNEDMLSMFRSEDNTTWTPQGFNTRNKSENWVEKTLINSFSRWTLSTIGNALPIQFTLFNIKCQEGTNVITWNTAQEQNSHRFDVQRSADGVQWTVIGSIPAAGTSATEKSYSYTDANPSRDHLYRIAGVDKDGSVKYTSLLRSSCASKDVFKLWPSPTRGNVFINIVTDAASTAVVRVFNSTGALIKQQSARILQGSNQLSIDLGNVPNGVYNVSAEWNNGQTKKSMQIIKH